LKAQSYFCLPTASCNKVSAKIINSIALSQDKRSAFRPVKTNLQSTIKSQCRTASDSGIKEDALQISYEDSKEFIETGGQINLKETDQKFEALFGCIEDRERLFECQMPELNYQQLSAMMVLR
jgi:hypothetical protein